MSLQDSSKRLNVFRFISSSLLLFFYKGRCGFLKSSLDIKQFARGKEMTPDVIYPSREFVLPAIRHSPRDFRRSNKPTAADYRTSSRNRSSDGIASSSSLSSSPWGCFALFFVWHDVEIDDRESRGPTRVFHFKSFRTSE